MRQRENDPLGMNKGDVNKTWNYETIEYVAFGQAYVFDMKSFLLQIPHCNNLTNPAMFTFPQFKLVDNFQEEKSFKIFKMKFHIVLGKDE